MRRVISVNLELTSGEWGMRDAGRTRLEVLETSYLGNVYYEI